MDGQCGELTGGFNPFDAVVDSFTLDREWREKATDEKQGRD
jgi:hypothetical protein